MQRPPGDSQLVQIVDAAFADAARRSGDWLVCRPGCTQCCHGVFAISSLDVVRLRDGLSDLASRDPELAQRVRRRAQDSVKRLLPDFPGDPLTGLLDETEDAQARFEDFANDEPCPALDPQTGRCDLYAFRPMTCRTFGPPVRSEDGIGVCDLCYHGASDEEIATCEMVPDADDLESMLLREMGDDSKRRTIVAFCLTG